ncbi:hypothetical protein GXW83_25630 [Streptacidiphilus sp. PB12-B1b]|uniref:DUF6879 family protein n=1 Tax=Streptacidiphilus sp. PB12-B1b TaxID=2705012 RepID=UPI0015F997CF|nr:DUF6879 family protein [Streptacidiphilus sp. PB12-B1b]QMU78585.1 hypothetical protein GXW83_25630 [Streptacidiphilus sp. PB12-B1b]
MPDLISGPAITDFFRSGFEHTAWRWETRRAYGVAAESDALRAFLRGEDVSDPGRPWLALMRQLREQGKLVGRVRLVDDPPTDYQRFLLADVTDSVEAGEDIRYLQRAEAQRRGLPEYDFWIFDSHTIGIFRFDGDRSLGMALTEDPAEVLRGCQIRDAAVHFAIPAQEFIAQVPSVR